MECTTLTRSSSPSPLPNSTMDNPVPTITNMSKATATAAASVPAAAGSNPATAPLKLYGTWASSYVHRVQLVLKLKGLQFEYVEEDLADKSPSLLLFNPVYKKVPVLLHGSRPIVESAIILQYIDEVWSENPIMPHDPFERAVVRFWCHFCDDKLGPAVAAVFQSSGHAQRAAVEQVHENLKLLEAELRDGFFRGRKFFGGEKIGLMDVVVGCGSYWLPVFEEVADVKLVDSGVFPLFSAWLREFESQKEVKEIIPASDKLIEYASGLRQMILSFAAVDCDDGTSSTSPGPEPVADITDPVDGIC